MWLTAAFNISHFIVLFCDICSLGFCLTGFYINREFTVRSLGLPYREIFEDSCSEGGELFQLCICF